MPPAHALPARPRPDPPHEAVPQAEGQDAGLRRADGRPLPDALTHTLETTRISRGVARALRLNEDLTEAIGLGHDLGHTPFGHAGEEALDRPCASTAAASATTSIRCGSTARARRRGQPHPGGARRDPHAHRAASRRRSRVRSSASSTASPTSTTTSTTSIRAGVLDPAISRGRDRGARRTGSRRIDTLVHDLVETSERAGDIVQSDEIGEAMLSLRAFMFERVYLGPRGGRARARPPTCARIFDHLVARGDGSTRSSTTSPG